jgi:glutathione synthase/RimK-type ligase-like ATP-grasp enzyme
VSRVALATCGDLPEGDPDDAPLVEALRAAGHATTWMAWDDEGADWAAYDLVLVRSTWGYQRRRDAFVAWARAVGDGRLVNPPGVIEWNTDKTYLRDVRAAGLPVVPTIFVPRGGSLPILEAEAVVKPTVSAGSRDTARFLPREEGAAQTLVGAIHHSGRTAMVQPYLPSVDERGETALLYFGGAFSHAIAKGPILKRAAAPARGLFAAEDIAPREPDARERAVAEDVVAWLGRRLGGAPAYARIDLVEGPGGGPLVLEVELTEPSLFLLHAPGAAERLVAALPLP